MMDPTNIITSYNITACTNNNNPSICDLLQIISPLIVPVSEDHVEGVEEDPENS